MHGDSLTGIHLTAAAYGQWREPSGARSIQRLAASSRRTSEHVPDDRECRDQQHANDDALDRSGEAMITMDQVGRSGKRLTSEA